MTLTIDKVRALRDAIVARSSCVVCKAMLMPDRMSAPHCDGCTVEDDLEAEWEQTGHGAIDAADAIVALCDEWLLLRRLTWAGGQLLGPTMWDALSGNHRLGAKIAQYGSPTIFGRDWITQRERRTTYIATFAPDSANALVDSFDSWQEAKSWCEEVAALKGYWVER